MVEFIYKNRRQGLWVGFAGWNYYFVTLWAACAVAILLLLPMVNLKNYVQREAAKKAALNKPKTA